MNKVFEKVQSGRMALARKVEPYIPRTVFEQQAKILKAGRKAAKELHRARNYHLIPEVMNIIDQPQMDLRILAGENIREAVMATTNARVFKHYLHRIRDGLMLQKLRVPNESYKRFSQEHLLEIDQQQLECRQNLLKRNAEERRAKHKEERYQNDGYEVFFFQTLNDTTEAEVSGPKFTLKDGDDLNSNPDFFKAFQAAIARSKRAKGPIEKLKKDLTENLLVNYGEAEIMDLPSSTQGENMHNIYICYPIKE